MCCFSQQVKRVSDTSIFCRMGSKGNQVVIYSMMLEANEDLAMILPIPVTDDRDESSVQFVDLSNYEKFFPMLDRAFPADNFGPFGATDSKKPKAMLSLKVETVGSFDASFVPTRDDFDRLDERFRISSEIWDELPAYRDHGFVVFKLKAGNAHVHPMAFAFPAKDRNSLVFPTIHIHDGEIHEEAEFDHTLYCQADSSEVKMDWQESVAPLGRYINAPAAKGAVRGDEHVYKKQMVGAYPNEDVAVAAI